MADYKNMTAIEALREAKDASGMTAESIAQGVGITATHLRRYLDPNDNYAPSLHIIRADIETTVSPIVGNEKQSEDMVNYLLQEFEGDTTKIWQSNIFGRSFHEIVNEDLQAKLKHMPDDARLKLRQTLERIINEGTGGLICIIL